MLSITTFFSPNLSPFLPLYLSHTNSGILLPNLPSVTQQKLFQQTKKNKKQRKNHRSQFRSSSNSFRTISSSSYSSSQEYKNPDGDIDDVVSKKLGDIGSSIPSCSSPKQLRMLHGIVVKFKGQCPSTQMLFLHNNLVCGYIRMGELTNARKLFDEMLERNVVSWTAMISGYLRFGLENQAFCLCADFFETGIRPSSKTFVCLMNLCSRTLDYELGRQVHACVLKSNANNLFVESSVVYFYAQFGHLVEAFRVFDKMKTRDVVCWTTMITACSQHGEGEESFRLFSRMLSDEFSPNEFTVCSVLKACGEEKALRFGRQLHGSIVKKMFRDDVFLGTSLVDMYAKCGEIDDSRAVFDGMRRRNMVTWTSIIAGYARNGLGEEAIRLFRVMTRRKIFANKLTLVSILRACGLIGALQTGKEIHAQILKNHIDDNIYIASTLVWLYCKSGDYTSASDILQKMTFRDVVSWTAMISGCARLGHEFEALGFLKEMLVEGVEPNPFTYSSALKACAKLEDVWQGKSIHSSITKTPALSSVFVGSALINMYAKCGYVSEATEVFDSMPEKNSVSWRAMIVGYARNGQCREAMKLMYQMQSEGFEVDEYIRHTVLTTCGELGEGRPVI